MNTPELVTSAGWWSTLNMFQLPTMVCLRPSEAYMSASFVCRTSKMSVIIRLQNLPWSANALDIRQYFRGLSIPEGGVHIVGGEQGDAFIAFR